MNQKKNTNKLEEVGRTLRALLISPKKPTVGVVNAIITACPKKKSLIQRGKLKINILHMRLLLFRMGIGPLIQAGKLEIHILHIRLLTMLKRQARA